MIDKETVHPSCSKLYPFLFAFFLLLSSCSLFKGQQDHSSNQGGEKENADGPPFHGVFVEQKGNEVKVEESKRVLELDRAPFSLRYYHRAYGDHEHFSQIAAFRDSTAFAEAEVGMKKQELPYFAPATGMATRGLYKGFFLKTEGHHYAYYKKDEQRLRSVGKEGEWLKLEFPVNYLHYGGRKRDLEEVDLSKLYVVVLIDRDGDDRMNEKELTKLVLEFDQDPKDH